MNKRLKLAFAALLGFSAACSSVRNTAKRSDAGPSEPEQRADSAQLLPTVELERPAIRVMYGVPRPAADSVRRAADRRQDAAAEGERTQDAAAEAEIRRR